MPALMDIFTDWENKTKQEVMDARWLWAQAYADVPGFKAGVMPAPLRDETTGRPYFTEELQATCVEVRRRNGESVTQDGHERAPQAVNLRPVRLPDRCSRSVGHGCSYPQPVVV